MTGVAAVAAEPVEEAVSAVTVLDAVAAVTNDTAVADVRGVAISVEAVTTVEGDAGVAVTSCDDGLALDGAVVFVPTRKNINALQQSLFNYPGNATAR